ncbi:hypothetical protein ASD24_24760 [Paenibacillus sp. Root52]|uniref:hypothetical protein n=1 Tax=Paenibacillus sp. Root52 TaxID=1736552 RepID=UPI00070223C5|nr:hypothetical protein [Paenibacillus sp. Root52]KQY91010.1 hypothetical protein ASD24_24760 [Paenibacillus sp. Root52]
MNGTQIASGVPTWLQMCFEQTPKPDLVTSSFLSQWGSSLLDTKMEHRQYIDPIFRRGRSPTKLSFEEIAATLMHVFCIKRMPLPAEKDALGIQIEGHDGIWNNTSQRIGEYLTDKEFINNMILLITPTHRILDTPNVTRHIRLSAPEINLPIPARNKQNDNIISDFWNSFEQSYNWDMIPLELLYRTYHRWFVLYQKTIEDESPSSPLIFKEQLCLLASERWMIHGKRMKKI